MILYLSKPLSKDKAPINSAEKLCMKDLLSVSILPLSPGTHERWHTALQSESETNWLPYISHNHLLFFYNDNISSANILRGT